jgi:hypothetical protein
MRLAVVAGPGCARAEAFSSAARAAGMDAVVVSYAELLAGRWEVLMGFERVRLETPGRDPGLRAALLAHGAAAVEGEGGVALSAGELAAGVLDRGRLVAPRQAWLGFRRLLRDAAGQAGLRFTNHPHEIALAFDKPACKAHLAAEGLPVAQHLGSVVDYPGLRAAMAAAGVSRAFVKLDCGASASGMLALAVRGPQVRAFTTVERAGAALYDTRRVRRLETEAEVAAVVEGLAGLGAHAERWLPKASLPGGAADLRVVTVAGAVTHAVTRVSPTPFTNLHLGGQRRPAEALGARVGPRVWADLEATARRVAACFPRSLTLGLDLAVGSDLLRHAVLEVNAFGDWLKGVAPPGAGPHDAQARWLAGGGLEAVRFDLDGALVGDAPAPAAAAVGARHRVASGTFASQEVLPC